MNDNLKPGDIIEVLEREMTGLIIRDVWKNAIILNMGDRKLFVQFKKEKEKRLYLSWDDQGRTWR